MRHLYHRGKGGVKIETMHPTAVSESTEGRPKVGG